MINLNSRLGCSSYRGTILIITLFFIVLMTLEVAMISYVMQRSVGEKAIAGTAYQAAKGGAQVAMQRIKDNLYAYIKNNGIDNVTTDFAKGGANDIDNEDLLAYNAEDSVDEDTGVDISAWIDEKRGIWYHIVVRAKYGDTELLAHDWVKVLDGCMASSGTAGLTTIASNVQNAGYRSTMVDTEGRVYFGQEADVGDNGGGSFWTWHPDTGLTTILSGLEEPGNGSFNGENKISMNGDRVFWGDNDTHNTYSYTPSTGLSTVIKDGNRNLFVSPNGTVYAGHKWGQRAYRWSAADGMSTLISTGTGGIFQPVWNWYSFYDATDVDRDQDAVGDDFAFFRHNDTIVRWHESQGISTVVTLPFTNAVFTSISRDGTSIAVSAQNAGDGGSFVWKSGILTTLFASNCASSTDGRVTTGGRFMMGGWQCRMFTYHPSTGLSTISNQTVLLESKATRISDGLTYFGNFSSQVYKYMPGTGLTTLISGVSGDARRTWMNDSGDYYFATDSSTNSQLFKYTLSSGTLSTLISGIGGNDFGFSKSLRGDNDTGNVYFGEDDNPGAFLLWNDATGLSTLFTGRTPGRDSVRVAPGQGVYFSEGYGNADGNTFYYSIGGDTSNGCNY